MIQQEELQLSGIELTKLIFDKTVENKEDEDSLLFWRTMSYMHRKPTMKHFSLQQLIDQKLINRIW